MRISSTQYFTMNVATMSDQQAQLSQLYAQISSGVSLCHAVGQSARRGAGRAIELDGDHPRAVHEQPEHGARVAAARMTTTLGSVTDVLQKVHTLVLNAGDGALNNGDRGSIATRTAKLAQPVDDARQRNRSAGQLPVRRLSKQRAAVQHEFGRRGHLFGRHRHPRQCRSPTRTSLRADLGQRHFDLQQRRAYRATSSVSGGAAGRTRALASSAR